MRDPRLEELLIDTELCLLDRVVGRCKYRIHALCDECIGGCLYLIGLRTGLLDVLDALSIEIRLRILDRLLRGVLRVGVQKSDIICIRIHGQHEIHDRVRVQRIRGSGNVGARRIHGRDQLRRYRIRYGGEYHRDILAFHCGLYDLCRRGRDRDDDVYIIRNQLTRDLVQYRCVALTIEGVILIVEADALLLGNLIQLLLHVLLDLIEGRMIHELNDTDLIFLPRFYGRLGSGCCICCSFSGLRLRLRSRRRGRCSGRTTCPQCRCHQCCHRRCHRRCHKLLLHNIYLHDVGRSPSVDVQLELIEI